MQSKNDRAIASSFGFIDSLIILVCFVLTHRVYLGNFDFSPEKLLVLIFAMTVSYVILICMGLYNPHREVTQNREISRLIWAWIIVVLSVGLFAFATRITSNVPRFWVASSAIITLCGLISYRLVFRYILRWSRKRGLNIRSIAIVGVNSNSLLMASQLKQRQWLGFSVEAFFYINEPLESELSKLNELEITQLLPVNDLKDLVENKRSQISPLDQIWLALPLTEVELIEEINHILEDSSVDVCVLADPFIISLINSEVTDYGEVSLVNISSVRKNILAEITKRLFDALFSCFVLLLVSPLFLIITILIKLDSNGPVFFRQKRYGMDGTVIKVWKFRSMFVMEDGNNVRQVKRNDPRVTRIGKILRHTSLDELPQFFNVVQGSMSVVGPRPHPVAHNEEFRSKIAGYMMRHKFKPGITGWAQVNGWRGETDTLGKMQKRIDYDLQYIRNWSIWFDMKIILMTLYKGFSGRNAY